MIVLDTNVLSALMRQMPDKAVLDWLDQQPRNSIYTTSVTILEIRLGLQILPAGKRRSQLTAAFDRLLAEELAGRIAPFDAIAAQHAADLMSARRKRGRPVELRDTIIAGIVMANRATLATRNTQHFADIPVPVIDPWSA